jgi:23S rRNA (uracil1939-C5)-methyltransferase
LCFNNLFWDYIRISKNGTSQDVYCSTGTLGICAAKHAKQVIGVEISPESALDARNNAKNNGCENVQIICGAVRYVLNQILEEECLPHADVAMVDPPRAGLDPHAIKYLLTLRAQKLLYISCNPLTQSQNIAELIEGGYQIDAIQPVDQFPQTAHIENIVILSLRD